MKSRITKLGLVCIALFFALYGKAQCAMCQASVESSLDSGSTAAAGLNKGVMYLFFLPFIFVSIFYFIYRKRQKYLSQFGQN